jgi:hypothetical protein
MTLIGKLLVLFNFVFSLGGLTWALVLYSNNVNYTDDPAKPPAGSANAPDLPPGKLWGASNEITTLARNKGFEESRLAAARSAEPPADGKEPTTPLSVAYREDRLAADRPEYLKQLQHQRTGANEGDPVKTVVFTDKGLTEPDPTRFGRPKLANATRPRAPWAPEEAKDDLLRSITYYEGELRKTMTDLVRTREDMIKHLQEDMKWTDRLLGTPDEKGLRQQVVDERMKWRELYDELVLLALPETTVSAESEILRRRYEGLTERVKELDDYLLRKYRVPPPEDEDED